MIEETAFILSFLLLFTLDLVTIAARTALQESSLAHLLSLREQIGEHSNLGGPNSADSMYGDPMHRDIVHAESPNRAIDLIHNPIKPLASLNLLLVFTRLFFAGWLFIALPVVNKSLTGWWLLLFLAVAGIILFFFEHSVANNVGHSPEPALIRFSLYIRICTVILTPLTALPMAVSKSGVNLDESPGSVKEQELKTMLDAGQEEGVIELDERRMINSVIDLGETLAREIMVPRVDIQALEAGTPISEAIDLFLQSGHSRLPVYEDNIDHMLGLLFAKDLLRFTGEGQRIESLRPLLRPAYFTPEAKRVDGLLDEMLGQRIHMAMVVDEYGGIAGLVTLEDIVEEILGEIRDEYDQAEELPYQAAKNGDIIFQGRIDLDDFNEVMGSGLNKDEADTLSGYVYNRLGHVPLQGEQVQIGNLLLIVEQVSARQIRKVRARWLISKEEDKKENNHVNG